ncbi:MAG: hypothetical protein K2L12_03415 [Clostridia bacterium]|nr:hypothetical protein [Clostridia bacterium]
MGETDTFLTDYGHCGCRSMGYKLIEVNNENPACRLWSPLRKLKTDSKRITSALKAVKRKLCLIELLLKNE